MRYTGKIVRGDGRKIETERGGGVGKGRKIETDTTVMP